MSAIRNSCVARGVASAAGQLQVYVVPAGFAFILKSLLADYPGATAGTVGWFLAGTNTSPTPFIHTATLTGTAPDHYSTWIVLNAGDSIYLTTGAANCHYWISGAVLPYSP